MIQGATPFVYHPQLWDPRTLHMLAQLMEKWRNLGLDSEYPFIAEP